MKIQNLLAIALLATTGAAFAQTTAPAPTDTTPRLDQREANQQSRIDKGVASGQLTNRETNRMERREAKLNGDEARAKADGTVTPAERAKLRREANRDSRAIYRQKHDRQHVAPAS